MKLKMKRWLNTRTRCKEKTAMSEKRLNQFKVSIKGWNHVKKWSNENRDWIKKENWVKKGTDWKWDQVKKLSSEKTTNQPSKKVNYWLMHGLLALIQSCCICNRVINICICICICSEIRAFPPPSCPNSKLLYLFLGLTYLL